MVWLQWLLCIWVSVSDSVAALEVVLADASAALFGKAGEQQV
jgi:hypothetical protein